MHDVPMMGCSDRRVATRQNSTGFGFSYGALNGDAMSRSSG